MKIDGSEFGAVTIDGTTYAHDAAVPVIGGSFLDARQFQRRPRIEMR